MGGRGDSTETNTGPDLEDVEDIDGCCCCCIIVEDEREDVGD